LSYPIRLKTLENTLQKHDFRGKTVTETLALAIEFTEIEELEEKIAPSGAWGADEVDL
jgi:hypothetical protein